MNAGTVAVVVAVVPVASIVKILPRGEYSISKTNQTFDRGFFS
jgi:hypothetical protein